MSKPRSRTEYCMKPICISIKCPYVHPERHETCGSKIILRKTKVCYNFDCCKYGEKCNFAHNERELVIDICKYNIIQCPLLHQYVVKKKHMKFELMKQDILFDKNVVKILSEIFTQLKLFSPDIDSVIISFFPRFPKF